jgi:hypothetical protein
VQKWPISTAVSLLGSHFMLEARWYILRLIQCSNDKGIVWGAWLVYTFTLRINNLKNPLLKWW